MLIIGITGGSGAGKTTALNVLKEMGASVIDCDRVYHELLECNIDMRSEIDRAFPGIVTSDGLDRKKLGAIVFQDEKALRKVGDITHKYVAAEVLERICGYEQKGGAIAAVDAIALIESGLGNTCDVVVGVVASRDMRAKRIMDRDKISEDYALMRIEGQKPEKFFRKNCDHILENNGKDVDIFQKQCLELFSKLAELDKEGKEWQ